MRYNTFITARRVTDETDRRRAVEILASTYHHEKHWVTDPAAQIPAGDLERSDIAWFIATQGDRAAGTLRVWYDPTYTHYALYGLKLLDPALRIEEFMRRNRIAEVARFAVKAEFRGQLMIAVALMRAATEETVARGYTHLVTDVFEDDPHSPYHFHTKVLGFQPVATHEFGELHCRSRRITLVLDLKLAYQRLEKSGNWLFRYLTGTWDDSLHRRLARKAPSAPIRQHKEDEGGSKRPRDYAEITIA
jgi:hypothetical protein